MKHPRLGMQTRCSGVVRNFDLCADLFQLLQGSEFRGSGIYCGDYTKRLAVFRVPTQLIDNLPDATPSDKSYDHVDAVGRIDFHSDFVGQGRLAGRVRHQDGVA